MRTGKSVKEWEGLRVTVGSLREGGEAGRLTAEKGFSQKLGPLPV